MIRYALLLVAVLSTTSPAFAFWEEDEKAGCTNWYGDRVPCGRSDLRRETLLAGQFASFYGDKDASLVGSYGQGILLSTVKSFRQVRFLFGGQAMISTAEAYINDVTYDASLMSADILLGASYRPLRHSFIQPIVELSFIGGFKTFEIDAPPIGVEEKNLAPSYGGRLSLGLDFRLWRHHSLRTSLDYQLNRVPGILEDGNFNFDSLGVSIGLVFL